MPELNSSNLQAAEYDPATSRLTISFKSGSVYEYQSVPPRVYEALLSSLSPGKYFFVNIRDQYATTRIG